MSVKGIRYKDANLGNDLHGEKGVPAQIDEVLVNANSFQAEYAGPYFHERRFHTVARTLRILLSSWLSMSSLLWPHLRKVFGRIEHRFGLQKMLQIFRTHNDLRKIRI